MTATTLSAVRSPDLGPAVDSPRALLDVEGLSVTYRTSAGSVTAVDDVSMSMNAGERIAVVGESGSGKTNLCLAIAGFLSGSNAEVTARRLRFGDVDLLARKPSALPHRVPGLAMVFQDAMTSLDPVWKIGSQLRAVIRGNHDVDRNGARELSREWLTRVGLTDTRRILGSRPYELSGGMRQRVMIALALCGQPQLLIADEPTSALDASLAREMMELLLGLTTELGTSLLMVSHDIHLCLQYSDQMIVMYDGRIVEQGLSKDLEHEAQHPYSRGLLGSVPTLEHALAKSLVTIPEPTEAGGEAGGCSFRPRCEYAHQACVERPPLITLGPQAASACWLAGDHDANAHDQAVGFERHSIGAGS